jgi:SAM-dependent methyltransferase
LIPRISKAQQIDSNPKVILNWGCGHTKSDKWVNIDANHSCGPDFVESVTRFPWDWETDSVDEIYMHHIIEHVSKGFHNNIFLESNRVLKEGGFLFIAYPDFIKCAQAFIDNKNGNREFWEWTIYGRQTSSGDFHICAITEDYILGKLLDCGFEAVAISSNLQTSQYTDCMFRKVRKVISHEEAAGNQWR